MLKLNFNQKLAVTVAALSALAGGTAQLTDFFSFLDPGTRAVVVKSVVSAATFLNTLIGAVLAVVTGQASMVKTVSAMEGVEPIRINSEANSTLARIAMDREVDNVMPAPGQTDAVREVAKGG